MNATLSHAPRQGARTDDGWPARIGADNRGLVHYLLTGLWPNLPVLLVGGFLVCLGLVFTTVVSRGVNPVSVLLTAVIVAPVFAGLVACGNRIVAGDTVGVGELFCSVSRFWWVGLRVALVPAFALALALVALEVLNQTRLALVPLAISGAVTVVTTLGATVALPLRVDQPRRTGFALWLTSLYAVARCPVPAVAVVAFGCTAVWATASSAVSFVLLVPGPLALVTVAAAWASLARIGTLPSTSSSERNDS